MAETYLLERAWLEDSWHDDVLVEVDGGRFTRVETVGTAGVGGASAGLSGHARPPNPADPRSGGDSPPTPLRGLVLPGFANTHSHAFHRALRGRTQTGGGTFWTWREQMYALAGRLDPDGYLRLARAVYREMASAGFTAVGEFHYLHHDRDGRRYADPHAMGAALVEAAGQAGLRLTLLDTLYLSSGSGAPPEGVQVRFADTGVAEWCARVDGWAGRLPDHARTGRALHSVRAVPADALARVPERPDLPLHVHLSEQVAENQACLAAHGVTPAALLAEHGHLGPATTVVHATHLTDADVALLGRARVSASFCPTTERDLGDGIGPSRALHRAGARLVLGSDSHAVVDPFEEMRALELDERLATQRRGHWSAAELLAAGTRDGHGSLGWPDAGALAVGHRADLVVLDHRSVRTAGTGADEHTAVFAATAADVRAVMADGRWVAGAEDRAGIGEELDQVIDELWRDR